MSNAEGQQPTDYEETPAGWASRWLVEVEAAEKALADWQKQGVEIDNVFLDSRETEGGTKWNLFTADVLTLRAMLYGNTPKADVSRRFADANDDPARVAGEALQRILHSDIEKRSDTATEAFGNSLDDWLLPGLGVVRVRYTMEETKVPGKPATPMAAAVPESLKRTNEQALIDYVHWKDYLYSPCKVWGQVTWMGYAADMAKGPFIKRFSEKLWALCPKQSKAATPEEQANDPWARVRVWELWHKDEGKVFYWVKGCSEILAVDEDPYGLDGFWPSPKPLFANVTTSKLVPRPDYVLAQDIYREINSVCTRIDKLQRAIKAVGLYDKNSPEIARLLSEACDNELLPTENWGGFLEKGGIQGGMQFLPLEALAVALGALRDYRRELMDALYQVTGQSDIMRGQSSSPGTTAHEQSIKAKFGSVRVQRRQDEFARFVSEAQALKAELVCKLFEPASILERANAQFFPEADKKHLPKAIELLKSQYSCYRIEVKPESVSLTDFAALKQDRTEVIGALSTFLTAAAPLVETMPAALPFLLQLLQATLAGLKGSSVMEGILDAAIEAAEAAEKAKAANPQQQPQDPKMATEQLKAQVTGQKIQADMQREQMKHQNKLVEIQAETQAHDQQEASQATWNVREAAQKQMVANTLKSKEPAPGGVR